MEKKVVYDPVKIKIHLDYINLKIASFQDSC